MGDCFWWRVEALAFFCFARHHLVQSYKDLNKSTEITLSPESQSTMGKYGGERVFSLPNGGTAIFELHIKLGNIRIHILEDNSTKKIIIGYIGKHLSI